MNYNKTMTTLVIPPLDLRYLKYYYKEHAHKH